MFILVSAFSAAAVYFLEIRVAETVLIKLSAAPRLPSSQSLEENIKSFLPFKNRLTDYFNLLGLSKTGVGNASINSGHLEYFKSRSEKNRCFTSLAAEYFRLIRKFDEKVGIYSKTGDTSLLKGRPAITDKIGQENRTHVKPGYAWDLALRMSQGDKHLALSLIASCGHDDELRMFDPAVYCPDRTSSLYAPGSLGSNFVMDQKTIDQIVAIQAPTLGGKALPAKYYHSIAAAFSACMAIKEGIPSWIVKQAQIYAVRTYRAKRLCDRFAKLQDSSPNPLVGQIDSKNMKAFRSSLNGKSLDEQEDLVRKYFADHNASVETRQSQGRLLINEMSFEGAITDFNSRYLFVQTFPGSIICNPQTTTELLSLLSYKKKLPQITEVNCPRIWNQDRCKEAIAKLKTWVADFEWSEASQSVGVDFASKNCPSMEFKQPLDHSACNALNTWNSGTQSTEAQSPGTK